MAEKCPSECFTFEVKDHGSKLLRNMNRARLEERFCDFKIQVGKQIIHTHKIVLAEGCDYFRAMLSHPMKESNEGIVEMVDVDFDSLEICVQYIYLGKVTVMKENLSSLLKVAHRLQLNELCEEASKNMEDGLSLDTFFTTKSLATSLDLKLLGEKCDNFALKNLSGIAQLEDFPKTDSNYLQFLMTAELPEAVKCKAFLIWANHDADNRGKKFEEFFLYLDLHKLPPFYSKFLEQNEPLFFNSMKCLRKVLQSNLAVGSCRDINLDTFQVDKEFSKFAAFDKISQAVQAYNPDENAWTKLHKFTTEINSLHITAIVVGEHVFVFAEDQRNWKLRYSDKNSTWSPLPRRSVTKKVEAVNVAGQIYAFDETSKAGKTVEIYDGLKWSYVTDKPVAGWQTYIVVAEGGYGEGSDVIATSLCFDIGAEVWTKVNRMSKPRYDFRAFPISGKIFSIGGFRSDNTVEEFDPVTGNWRTVMTLSGKNIVATASVAL